MHRQWRSPFNHWKIQQLVLRRIAKKISLISKAVDTVHWVRENQSKSCTIFEKSFFDFGTIGKYAVCILVGLN